MSGELLSNDRLASSAASQSLVRLILAYFKGHKVRVIDDDITPHNSSLRAASTKELRKERKREERKIECQYKK